MTTHPTFGVEFVRHGYARAARNRRLFAAAVCLLLAAGIAWLIVYSTHAPPSPRETPAQRRQAEWVFGGFGALSIAGALLSVRGLFRERDVEARGYERGFTYREPRREPAALAWDRVESVQAAVRVMDVHGVPVRTIRLYEVRGDEGTVVTFGDTLADAERFVATIIATTRPRLCDRARATIARGGTADFGPLSATREGLMRGGATLPWPRVAAVEVDRYGALVVRDRDARSPWARVDAAEIVNLNVLLRVSEELRQG